MFSIQLIFMNLILLANCFVLFIIFSKLYSFLIKPCKKKHNPFDTSHISVQQKTYSNGCPEYELNFINDLYPSRNITYTIKSWMIPILKMLATKSRSLGYLRHKSNLGAKALTEHITEIENMGIVKSSKTRYSKTIYNLTRKGLCLVNFLDEPKFVLNQTGEKYGNR